MKKFITALILVLSFSFSPQLYSADPDGDFGSHICFDPDMNRYLSVFYTRDSGDVFIKGIFVDSSGTAIGSAFTVGYDEEGSRYNPKCIFDSSNKRYFVVWYDYRNGGVSGYDIYGQFIYQDGTLKGENLLINDDVGDAVDLDFARDTTNKRYLLVWKDDRDSDKAEPPTGEEIYGQLLDEDGATIKNAFSISKAYYDQQWPDVLFDNANNKYFVVWQSNNGSGWDIIGRFVDADGIVDESDVEVSTYAFDQLYPQTAFDPGVKRYVVVWRDGRGTAPDIYSQAITSEGGMNGGNYAVTDSLARQDVPAIAWGSDSSNFLAIWTDDRSLEKVSLSQHIYGRFVHDSGDPTGDEFNIDTSDYHQAKVYLAYNSNCENFMIGQRLYDGITPAYVLEHTKYGDDCATPPKAPELVFPENGATGMGTNVTFKWNKSSDGENEDYTVTYCANEYFESCSPHTFSVPDKKNPYALAGLGGILLLSCVGLAFVPRRRRGLVALLVTLPLLALLSFTAVTCSSENENELTYSVEGLEAGTTYYWKVKADEGSGASVYSETWSFTTKN